MDKTGADFKEAVKSIKTRLGGNAVMVQLNIGTENQFEGLIDLPTMKAFYYDGGSLEDFVIKEIPADLLEEAQTLRNELIEAVANFDEELMVNYLDGKEISSDEIKKAIRKGTLSSELFPAFCGTAFKNKGVKAMLDAVIDYLPSPLDIPAITGELPNGEKSVRKADDNEPFAALAFKVMTDPYVGRLTFFRVYSGTLNKGSYVLNATKDNRERIGRILEMHANSRKEITDVSAGDIAAAVGLKNTTTGDTLSDINSPIVLEKMVFPEPVISLALEPANKAASEKLSLSLQKLAEEDPTFRTYTDDETGQTIIAGMGELHLDILVERLRREFKVDSNVGKPQVSYRETITLKTESEGKYIKQTGGRGQYGHV
jgi:elongation factor G